MSVGKLEEYVHLCVKNKIDQLNLPDGTVIKMSPLAYYDVETHQKPAHESEIPTNSDLGNDTIDEDILFASAR